MDLFILVALSFALSIGLMYIIKSNGWDRWNEKKDRWK